MGYTTDFEGALTLTPAASPEQIKYIKAFSGTRRMKRNADLTAKRSDPIREAVGLPVGIDGGFFVGAAGENYGQEFRAEDVIDSNESPGTPCPADYRSESTDFSEWYERFSSDQKEAIRNGAQPGLWCQWVLTADGTQLEWDGGEKFYNYVEWLQYLITNFFEPWGIKLNGQIEWFGEDRGDFGKIVVIDNKVEALKAKVSYTY